MHQELTYVLVTPYTLRKGRHGGILSRLLSQTGLDLAGAQILTPDEAFCRDYAALMEKDNADCDCHCGGKGVSAYIRNHFQPVDGKKQRTMLLLLRGENAVEKVRSVTGHYPGRTPSDAMTIRDTYADLICDASGKLIYAEPAVMIPNNASAARAELELLAAFAERSANVTDGFERNDAGTERTLVILKPDNWRRPSIRPGAIMDIFTRTGLRLAGCKMHWIPVADALEFYGPVQYALREKLAPKIATKARQTLQEKFGIEMRPEGDALLTQSIGLDKADHEFYSIVEFMTGRRPEMSPESELNLPGKAKCMVLIYEGENPVEKVRTVLGPTDSAKAPGGTVRGEFGTDVMVNAAHASDSQESFRRESAILKIDVNTLAETIRRFYAEPVKG